MVDVIATFAVSERVHPLVRRVIFQHLIPPQEVLLSWIVRVRSKQSKTKGWQARIPYGAVNPSTKSRRYRSRLFSDAAFGGSTKAKAAAERWLKSGAKALAGSRRTKRR